MRGRYAGRAGALLLTVFGCIGAPAAAQEAVPSRSLVDTPTAGLVPRGSFETAARVFPAGGLEVRLDVGILRWLSLGASYGGLRIIGDGSPEWYPAPGFFGKLRVLEETYVLPALAFGIDTRGTGWWDESRDRYQFKSRGIYGVLSKNYDLWGDLALHLGLGRSLDDDGDNDLSPWVGAEKSVFRAFALALEYDLATNDDRDDGVYGQGRGYFNAFVSWNLAPRMQVRFSFRDMLDNSESAGPADSEVVADEGWGRELSFLFVESF